MKKTTFYLSFLIFSITSSKNEDLPVTGIQQNELLGTKLSLMLIMVLKCFKIMGIKNLMLGVFLLFSTTVFSQPTITNFSPKSGAVGTLVTITGINLTNPNGITIAGVSAIPISNNGNTLVAMVMPGATNGGVIVTTAGGTANGSGNFLVTSSQVPNTQQGNKLVGTGSWGPSELGSSVSLSADGNTAIVGGPEDSSSWGAAWVFTRSGGVWTQQGKKLVGTGVARLAARQGISVSISADGNTAIVGGYTDDIGVGAAWVYTRSGGVWTQQGNKLVGTGSWGLSEQGSSVSISADGNTAIVGGAGDSSRVGAAWVYTRSGGVWTQQGNKLVGKGAVGYAAQGGSVSISADGNTAIVGGSNDNSGVGAAWVYTRSGGVWTQQGNKLVGTGAVGNGAQGYSVSLSADGNTAIVGGYTDNINVGAAWVYTRSGGVWTQQGNKLVGTAGNAQQGYSVSISADGNTAIVGGFTDNINVGAAWVYKRSGGVWTQQGNKLVGTGAQGKAQQGISISLSADGNTAIVGGSNDNSGVGASWVYTYLPPAPTITSFAPSTAAAGAVLSITGTNFIGTSNITLGGTPVASFTVLSSTTISAIVGNGSTGSVGVTSAGGSASLSGFTFIPAPVISSINPTSAGLGTSITITGSNLTGATSVTLGGTAVASFTVLSSTTITAIVGTGSTGSVGVTSAGGSASLSGFTFIPAPVISSINPTSAGLGTSITITGSNLTGATSVTLGGTAVASFTVLSSTTIRAIVGTGSTGSVGVTSAGGSASLSGFTFIPAPVISSINPTSAGLGTSITITGTNFTGITSVTLGGTAVASFTALSTTTIRAIVGTGSTGSVGVTSAGGSASLSGFTFIPALVISSINPTSAGLGTSITITGTNFTGITGVTLGGTAVSSFTVLSSTTISAIVGNGSTGSVGVTSAGGSASLSGFTFIPAPVISSINPTSAGLGTSITITGSNLTGATSVTLGGTVVASFTVLSSTTISAIVGNGSTGSVGVTSAGGSASLSGFTFIPAPVISSINPTLAGLGTSITITGTNFTGITSVTLGGTAVASFTVLSSTTISAIVGNGSTGSVGVTSAGGSASLSGFIFIPAPVINSFNPTAAGLGATITITGSNFTGATSVTMGGTAVTTFTVVSSNTIIAIVGNGSTGSVGVTSAGGSASLSGFTFIPAPVISSFNPTAAGLGATITITGSNFTGATSVTLGGTAVSSFSVLSSTTIRAIVGNGSTGSVGVTSAGGSASLSGFTFIPAPVISSFNPTTAGLGATITITGSNFTGATSVTMEGTVVSSFTVLSSTTIIAVVGNGTSGNVVVVTPGGTAQKPGFTFGNPTLSINMLDSLQTFGAIKGTYSKVQNYSISGLYLQNDVQIVAPDSFQVSKSFGSGFSKNLVLSTIGGKLDTTKIYVRFKSDMLGNYSGNITHVSTNAIAKNISVVGNSNCDSIVYFTPIVNNISKDTILCFRDSIVLSPSNGSFNFYKWSSGETSKNIVAKNSGSYKLQVGSGAGCLSNESIPVKLNKNTNPIPSIALVGDNLISTNSNAYRWFFNNNLLNGNNSNLLKPSKVGFYTVETSIDNICWDRSTDYPLISIPNSSIKDSIQIKTYPNPTSTGLFHVVVTLTKNTNVTASVTVVDGNGNVLIQTSKLIFFGREIKIPITLSFRGTVFAKVDVNGVVKIQTVILQ